MGLTKSNESTRRCHFRDPSPQSLMTSKEDMSCRAILCWNAFYCLQWRNEIIMETFVFHRLKHPTPGPAKASSIKGSDPTSEIATGYSSGKATAATSSSAPPNVPQTQNAPNPWIVKTSLQQWATGSILRKNQM